MEKNETELSRMSLLFSQGYLLILEREKITTIIIQLFIALLVIATFSEKIIPQSALPMIKIIIVFMLALIPILIWDYLLKINDGINSITKALSGEQEKEKLIAFKISSVYYFAFILTAIIDILCYIIVNNFFNFIVTLLFQLVFVAGIVFSKRKIYK